MRRQAIVKDPTRWVVRPNLQDYAREHEAFSWAAARKDLEGLPAGRGLNIAHEAVDRHAAGASATRTALRFAGRSGVSELSYAQLRAGTARFANVLRALGVERGERVFTLLGRRPELYLTALGSLKNVSVFSPLFSAFGPEPVRQRLTIGDGRVLVTSRALYKRKVAPIRDRVPGLAHVLLVDPGEDPPPETLSFPELMAQAGETFEIPPTDPEDMALLHFTSGTTGTPKGAIHVHDAVLAHHVTSQLALDLHPQDVFWCTADPGWVTGTSYGIIAPLTHGVTALVDTEELDVDRWYRLLAEQRVTVWYTAPTALRMLMRAGASHREGHDLSALRFIASVGEPLNPEVVAVDERDVRTAGPRQLVADRDRRDHDLQLRRVRDPSRLDGASAAGHRGGRRGPGRPRRTDRRRRPATPRHRTRPGGRARAASGVAQHVPRLPARTGPVREVLRR